MWEIEHLKYLSITPNALLCSIGHLDWLDELHGILYEWPHWAEEGKGSWKH
jgi:hypothetical protein